MDEYTYDTTPKSKEHEDAEAYDDYMDVEEPNPFPWKTLMLTWIQHLILFMTCMMMHA